jgi:hypothetical protein
MPYKSKAQQRYLNAKKPAVAAEFNKATPKQAYKNLPDKVRKNKKGGK